ncbi:Type I phosphodiesterase / nucleotide pyrophosphatase [Pedobacter steynii]|uniref:Type I phosphodiesterase / nucleotide pyrophosphatase n=2 Tax=Pedobacter steynii TaxID=430522 RepID=A0A1G9VZQ1_9SPHI|nr:Type I phosphodiesterase / nucleotide pyrophosphatase [Pedobacter steynii]
MKLKNTLLFTGALIISATVFNACKRYENPPQVFEEYGDNGTNLATRKVLVINIDGAVGADIKTINPPNIAALIKTGKYSFTVLRDAIPTDGGSIASMLTGVSSAKHKIVDDTYIPHNGSDDDHSVITNYPSVFSRMLDVRPEFKTVTITTDVALNKYVIHSDHRILNATDALVKDSAVNILQNNNARMVFVDFRDVKTAGKAGGFAADAPAYKGAIEKTDGYVGEMVAALKKRKDYAKEDWLIIVTTNRGGDESNSKPGFLICSNPSFKEKGVSKEGFNTMHFKGTSTFATVNNDNGLYNAGTDKDFTVQLQIKSNVGNSYPGFFSKSTGVSGGTTTGWTMMQDGTKYSVIFGGSANGGTGKNQINGNAVFDGKWHTITVTVKLSGGVRTATLYTDGLQVATGNITAAKDLSTTGPLTIGHKNIDGSSNLDFYAADIEYFNVALDATTVKDNIALKDVTKHPKYANLIGYWPLDDGGGAVINNVAPTGYNFLMKGSGTWDALGNDIPGSRSPQNITDGTLSVIATGADVTALTFYWLKVPVISGWGLDGVSWISNFEIEFIK